MHTFVLLLKTYCRQNNISYSDLAAELGLDLRRIYAWTSKVCMPRPEIYKKIVQHIEKNSDLSVNSLAFHVENQEAYAEFFDYTKLQKEYSRIAEIDIVSASQYVYYAAVKLLYDLKKEGHNVTLETSIFGECYLAVRDLPQVVYVVIAGDEFIQAAITFDLQNTEEFVKLNKSFYINFLKLVKQQQGEKQ